jgi:hypothetical protein
MWNDLVTEFYDVMLELSQEGILYSKTLPDKDNKEKVDIFYLLISREGCGINP